MAALVNARQCTICALGLVTFALSGCLAANHTDRGALVGAGLGAGTGAIIGHQSGNGEAGAVIGGMLGTIGGALVGNAEDARLERDAALAQLAAAQQPAHPPLSNFDLIRMTQAGLGEEVIINSVKTRGGQFDLSPDGLIALKSSGVSDPVIQCVQTSGAVPAPTGPITQVMAVSPPAPGIVIVRPQPVVGVHLGVGAPYPHRHHIHRHRPRSGVSFSWQKFF